MSKEKQDLGENELLTWGEKVMGDLRPYGTQIGLFALLVLVGFAGMAWWLSNRSESYSLQWRELSLATTETRFTQNSDRLLDVASSFPNQKAGIWSLQLAGDYDMRTGLDLLPNDKEGAMKLLQRAKENYQKVVEAQASIKSEDLQQSSLFSLAYAHESLGEFGEAKDHYKRLIEAAPDSPFAKPAKRGLDRCSNDAIVAAYNKFKEWKPAAEQEAAPGELTPDRPDIAVPGELDDIEDEAGTDVLGTDGGDFDPKAAEATTDDAPATEKKNGEDDESSAENKGDAGDDGNEESKSSTESNEESGEGKN